jgi:tetratricopeptide (TPR) repeat protein
VSRFRLTLICALTASAVAGAFAQSQAATDLPALFNRLNVAAMSDDVAGLKEIRIACLRLLASPPSPDSVPVLRYSVAYAGYRMAFAPAVTDKEQRDFLDEAQAQLEAITKGDARNAEALALMSAVYGAKIAKAPDMGMTLGPASSELIDRAAAAGPNNPRVLLIRAQSQFHTPPEYGGSIKDAEATIRRALQAFDQEPSTKAWPNWGRFDAHAWLGQMLAARNDKAGAKAEYDKALAIAPNSQWVKYVLMPAVR